MKAIVLEHTGGPEVLQVHEIETPEPDDDEILVKIKYSGINYADLLSRQGLYSWAPKRPYIMGLEAAGEVVEKGRDVDEAVDIGDRVVVGTQRGGYAEYITVQKDYILPGPEQYDWKELASFGVNWFTSWVALHEMARVRRGERLLVQAAAGGVGTAAVQLGLVHDMEVFGTSSQQYKRDKIEELGATAFDYDEFDSRMVELDKQPDCVIETIGGDVFERSFEILRPMGRIVLVGASGIQINKWNPLSWYKAWRSLPRAKMSQVLRRSRAFMGLHIGYMMNDPQRLRPSWEELLAVVDEFDLHPEVSEDQVFPMSRAADAHQFIHERKNIGKVLLDPTS